MRSFTSALGGDLLQHYQRGTLRYTYRGRPCLKSPIDLALYLKLIWELKPRTLIEIGSKAGGGALLLADIASIYGLGAHVYSIDLAPPGDLADDRITFAAGDVHDLGKAFGREDLAQAPHPWLVIEDSAHSFEGCRAALAFFARVMDSGDVLVMEDGVLDDLGLSDRYDGGPNRAIGTFLAEAPETFQIMTDYCDFFGPNATYNPNGYLRKS